MSGPITWRSIMGADQGGVSRVLQNAQGNFTGAFDVLNRALEQRQAVNQGVLDRGNEAAKQGYLNDLAAITDPEGLAQQRQAFQARLTGLAPEVQASVRDQFDQRMDTLRTRSLQEQQYQDGQAARQWAPVRDQLESLANSPDAEVRASALAAAPLYGAAGMPKTAEAARAILSASRGTEEFAQKQVGWERDAERFKDQQETNELQRQASRESLEATREQRNEAKATREAESSFFNQAEAHKQRVLQLGQQQGELAGKLGLPTVNGLPDYAAIEANADTKTLFDKAVNSYGLALPSDTSANNAAIESLRKQGTSGALLAKLRGQGNAFSTGTDALLVGEDAAALKRTQSAIDKKQAEVEKSNSLFISSTNVIDQMPALMKQLKESGVDDEGTRIVQNEVMKSLKFNPDTPLHIPAILSAAATSESWNPFNWSWETFRTNYGDTMKELNNSEAYKKQLIQFQNNQVELKALKDRRALSNAAVSGKVPLR